MFEVSEKKFRNFLKILHCGALGMYKFEPPKSTNTRLKIFFQKMCRITYCSARSQELLNESVQWFFETT